MFDFDKPYFVIKAEFAKLFGARKVIEIEERFCKYLKRVPTASNRIKLWQAAALQDEVAVSIINEYEEKIIGKRY